jgi:cation:H+ antiporter
VTLIAAHQFASRLDRLGLRFGFPEALIGLFTAVAADGPELASALFALGKGDHGVSTGVLVGSCNFNLAAMVGLSALIVGSVRIAPEALLLDGAVGLAVTAIASAALLGWVSAPLALVLAVVLLIPYLVVLVGGSEILLTDRARSGALGRLLAQRRPEPQADRSSDPTHHLLAVAVFDVVLIVAGSAGMVQAAISLGDSWHISGTIVGVLVLAPLTSLPNAWTAVRLGSAGRGAALVAETLNSNTINLFAGAIVPAVFVTLTASSSAAKVQLAWLGAMTLLALGLLMRSAGVRRPQAGVLILVYVVFVVVELALG